MSAAALAPRLRLAEGLLTQGRSDEAERVLLPLAGLPDAEAQAALAELHLAQGRPAAAAAAARAALASGPLPTRRMVAVASTLARAHAPEAADAALAQAIDGGDTTLDLRIARARLAEEQGRTDLALRHWQRATSLAATHVDARLGMIRALRGEGRHAAADRLCRSLVAAAPKDHRAAAEYARIAQDAGDPVEAVSRWQAALLAHPTHLNVLLGLAQALAAQHRFAEAQAIAAELAEREPARPEPRVTRIRMALAEGDQAQARRLAEELVERFSGVLDHHLLLGRVYEAAADGTEAVAIYRALIGAWPASPEPRVAAGELAARRGEYPAARAQFEQALGMAPGHLAARLGLAAALAELGLAETAGEAADAAVALAPNQPRTRLARAAVAETLGRLDSARLALLEARSALPSRVEPLLALAQLALRQGAADQAVGHAHALLTAHPRHLGARLTAFDAAMAAGDAVTAENVLRPLAVEQPAHREVQRRLARLDWLEGAIAQARERWNRLTLHDPRIHGGPDPIERLDAHPLPEAQGEVRAFLLVRNERLRLPWLLSYYRALGVDRFLVLDNGSDDGTREWLLAQGPDTHLFHTAASFAESGAGMRWTNQLLDRHGSGAWCLTVDADEALVYPSCETAGLKSLTAYLDRCGVEAMAAPMLDLYAAKTLERVAYTAGTSLIQAFPWFDATGYVRRDSNDFPFFRLHGGCRARVFHEHAAAGPVLQKVPLIRWQPEIKYTSSKHTAFPCRLADVSGVLLHFKYLPEFAAQVRAEVARGQHFMGAKEYRAYQRRLDEGGELTLMGPPSCRYRDSAQLVALGLMQAPPAYMAHVHAARGR